MNANSMTATHAAGVLDARAVARIARSVASVRREAGRWPWPLPAGSVLAALPDRTSVLEVLDALTDAGIDPQHISMTSGVGGARRLREAYTRRRALARLASLINDEGEVVAAAEAWCDRGAAVMLVRAPDARTREGSRVGDRASGVGYAAGDGSRSTVAAIFARHGGRILRQMGSWTFTGSAGGEPVAGGAAPAVASPRPLPAQGRPEVRRG